MKAMILAAGEGRRLRPLTEKTPKPLLPVGGKPLLEWHIERLVAAGYREIVVNAAYLGDQIVAFVGDGSAWGASISVSVEPEPLETAGGIIKALPLLGEHPFLLVNGDVFTDFPFERLRGFSPDAHGGHLVMVPNPVQHPNGDFSLEIGCDGPSKVHQKHAESLTYSGIAVLQGSFFDGAQLGKQPLRPFLDRAISKGVLTGETWSGLWEDVGTPERLAQLDAALLGAQ